MIQKNINIITSTIAIEIRHVPALQCMGAFLVLKYIELQLTLVVNRDALNLHVINTGMMI